VARIAGGGIERIGNNKIKDEYRVVELTEDLFQVRSYLKI